MRHFQDTWSHASEFSNIVDVIIPPDTLLPCQMPSNRASYRPETSLILAVCSSALLGLEHSYRRPRHKALVERGEILSWVHGDGGAISFEVVCEALAVDPEILRAAIVAWCRDMERGKFRKIVVRQRQVKGADNKIANVVARGENKERYNRRRRQASVQAAMEVQP